MSSTHRILVTVVPFCEFDSRPLEMLRHSGAAFTLNPLGRKLKEDELADLIPGYDVLVASTEPITRRVLDRASNLKMIARVGIGLDSIDLQAVRERGIPITYTPDAPSDAVAELTVGQMVNLLRSSGRADRELRSGHWRRWVGRRLALQTIGIIGVGRVGKRVLRLLESWHPSRVLANDLSTDDATARTFGFEWTDKETIYREADVITIHVPLTHQTRHMVDERELSLMKPDAVIINMSRGGIIREDALANALRSRPEFSAAIDVFEEEPYGGALVHLPNCVLTCHMGSCSRDARLKMEFEATAEALRFVRGEPFANPVPDAEYQAQLKP